MLVGRTAEQQAIDRLMAAARLGTSGVLAVTGEAGVGKTALIDDAVARSSGMRVLRATGIESEREIPFAMLLQLLRPALGALADIPPVPADALTAALALPHAAHMPGAVDGRDRFAIGAAVLSLLGRYSEDGPVAVVVDDLQLADLPSAQALAFAARRLAADPVVVLCGVRTPEGDAVVAGLPTLALGGLDLDAARALVTRARGRPTPDDHLRDLHRATAGNPLALLELRASDIDVIESLETGLPLRVPRAVSDAFGRRLDHLDADCRAALLVAAVCGTDLALITEACTALGIDVAALGRAEADSLVAVQGGRVEFRHPLLRAAAYSRGSAEERRAAHRAAGDATPRAEVDRRAWHLAEATWHPDAEVADLLDEAGRHAMSRSAHAVASAAFERSARLSPEESERARRLLRAADVAWTSGDGRRALALLADRARHLPEHAPVEGREIELRASVAARSGSLREALRILIHGANAAEHDADADTAAIALADAVHATFYLGDARTASALATRLDLLRPRITRPRARVLGLLASGIARILGGGNGADEIRAAVPLLESDPELRHDPRRMPWLLLAPLFLRDATGGTRLRTLVDEVRGAVGIGALPAVLFHVARDEATTGAQWARAEADYTESIRLAWETGQETERAMSLAGLAWLDSRAGRADACRAHGEEARTLCAAREVHIGEVWVGHALGDLDLSLGEAERAATELEQLADLLDALGIDDVDLSPAPERADALMRLGRREEAAALADDYRDRAARKGQPWARARAERARGMVADDDAERERRFRAALALHAQTLDSFETARTRLAYGERLRRTGRRIDAREQLRAAFDAFTELGAAVWSRRAADELTATGEHVRAAGADPLAALTPQELQVSVLLGEGRTTREAAAALFLSPKTVEYHLRKVYVKLGISSRSELVARLRPGARPEA